MLNYVHAISLKPLAVELGFLNLHKADPVNETNSFILAQILLPKTSLVTFSLASRVHLKVFGINTASVFQILFYSDRKRAAWTSFF